MCVKEYYIVIYKDKYFFGYDENGKASFTNEKNNAWTFKDVDDVKDVMNIAKLKLSKCTIKKVTL